MKSELTKKAIYKSGDLGDFLKGKPEKPLIVILGPTASGKTELSLNLAEYLDHKFGLISEIINADSRQLYRGMDIGTAKIEPDEMRGIPHHLFSVLDPDQSCSISWYQKEAMNLIDMIHKKDAIPMMVGGSMLYLSTVIDGLVPLPSNAELRRTLETKYDQDQGVELYKTLEKVDPVSAAAIPRQNKKYLVRAMEIYETTGKPKSEALKKTNNEFSLFIIGIEINGEVLLDRIAKRTHRMFERGFVGEVKKLILDGYKTTDPGMQSLGYREIAKALINGLDLNKEVNNINVQTFKYAKRQMTWWKRDSRIRWMVSGSENFGCQ